MRMFENLESRQLMAATWSQFIATELNPNRAWQYDTNRDGRADVAIFDRNRDRVSDAMMVDTNVDGRYDAVWVDTNFNGRYDVLVFSTRNNTPDRLAYDRNEDGRFDALYADYGRDGTFRYLVSTTTQSSGTSLNTFSITGGVSGNLLAAAMQTRNSAIVLGR